MTEKYRVCLGGGMEFQIHKVNALMAQGRNSKVNAPLTQQQGQGTKSCRVRYSTPDQLPDRFRCTLASEGGGFDSPRDWLDRRTCLCASLAVPKVFHMQHLLGLTRSCCAVHLSVILNIAICIVFAKSNFVIRSYHQENRRSHQNSQLKPVWAGLVLG
jgi:hypothetical protein